MPIVGSFPLVILISYIVFTVQVKPTTVQVNLSSCCVVSQELSAFAQQNDVQVLTHNDAAGKQSLLSFS